MWDIKMKTKQKWNLIQESISKRPISTKHNPKYITKTVKFCGKFNVLGLHQKQWYKKVDKNQWNIEQWKIYFYAKVSPITRYSREWNIPTWWVTLPYITCNKNKFLIDKDITLLQDWSAVQSFDFIILNLGEENWKLGCIIENQRICKSFGFTVKRNDKTFLMRQFLSCIPPSHIKLRL